jgi:uncharacterized protein
MHHLLDVNVLIALFDQHHIFHERAHLWLEGNVVTGIATCPLTENGVVRIIAHPEYSRAFNQTPSDVIQRVDKFCKAQDHAFLPDDFSLTDLMLFPVDQILGTRQVTDLCLLSLEVKHGGRLVTFDKSISLKAVRDTTASNLQVI